MVTKYAIEYIDRGVKKTDTFSDGHEKQLYSWEDPMWSRPATYEDSIRLLCAIVDRAIEDEYSRPTSPSMSMTGLDKSVHDRYLFGNDGLAIDADYLGMDVHAIRKEIAMRRVFN